VHYITGTYFFSQWPEFTLGDILWYFCFGNPEVRELKIFGNSVFLKSLGIGFSGIWYSRSGFMNFRDSRNNDKSWKFQKNFPKNFKFFFFSKFSKKTTYFFSFSLQYYWIFGIPEHFRYWAFLMNPKKKKKKFSQKFFHFLDSYWKKRPQNDKKLPMLTKPRYPKTVLNFS
jgi:hypothetical protein